MSEAHKPDPVRTAELAQQIVNVLAKEDSPTRQRAIFAALTILGEEAPAGKPSNRGGDTGGRGGDEHVGGEHRDLATFFKRDEKLKASDYAQLCAAYHFSQYGDEAFTLEELRKIATEAGETIPDRLDMTLKAAKKNKKTLFQSAGRDRYKPTAAAKQMFKERWGVRPGKNTKPTKDSE
ncbi:MAG: hypothetical protein KF859_13445 [Phycisphaeraceae bacterium]|nr:hypothetical protein [Phycisphaeraceae bacterium]